MSLQIIRLNQATGLFLPKKLRREAGSSKREKNQALFATDQA
jgi:hypothetical protein